MDLKKVKINSMNRKLFAGVLTVSVVVSLTSYKSTAFGNQKYWFEYKKGASGNYACSDFMVYSALRETKVVVFESEGSYSFSLAYPVSYNRNDGERRTLYCDTFGGKVIYDTLYAESYLNFVEEFNLTDYLVSYDSVKYKYTEQELKDVLEQIKSDYTSQKNKQLVKE